MIFLVSRMQLYDDSGEHLATTDSRQVIRERPDKRPYKPSATSCSETKSPPGNPIHRSKQHVVLLMQLDIPAAEGSRTTAKLKLKDCLAPWSQGSWAWGF